MILQKFDFADIAVYSISVVVVVVFNLKMLTFQILVTLLLSPLLNLKIKQSRTMLTFQIMGVQL